MLKNFHKTAIIAGDKKVSYTELLQHITQFASVLPQKKGTHVVILSENREGWIYTLFAIWKNQCVAIPVDCTSTVDDIAYILQDCKPACICTSLKKADLAREAVRMAGVETKLLIIDGLEETDVSKLQEASIEYDEEDTCLIVYTSGTTGEPKGVMLSFCNLLTNVRSVWKEVSIFGENRRTLILLPTHHILPLNGTIVAPLMSGGGVAICPSLSGPEIMETICKGQVGIIIGVPRLWQTIYSGIMKKINAHLATRLLFALCKKVNSYKFSRMVFRTIHQRMGGHVEFIVSGGAALDPEIGEGLKTLGFNLLEGYGMTETAPIITFTRPFDYVPGSAGKVLPCMEIKLVDGELCAKGPNVMKGYYNRPEETAAIIDSDGFIHTGDLARIESDGRVYITGRSKEIIVLSNGKNIQPYEIEYQLEKFDLWVKEAAVVQDGGILRAVIVPQDDWSKQLTDEEVEETLKRKVIEPLNMKLANYKKVKGVYVYRGELPRTKLDKLQRFKVEKIVENGLHTQKVKDHVVEPTYKEYQLIKNFIEAEKKTKVRPTDNLETDLAFDSLDSVELAGFIEHSFGIRIKVGDLILFPNVKALAEHVLDKGTCLNTGEVDWGVLLREGKIPLKLPTSSLAYPLQLKFFKQLLKLHNSLKVYGTENIPESGPFILAANHQSFIDAPLVMAGIPWSLIRDSYFYATETHMRSKTRRWFAQRHNIILMERDILRISILKLAQVLKKGKNVVIFPEGSRTYDGEVNEFKKTFAILSTELNVPIVPVCISGAFEAMPRGQGYLRRRPVKVTYLPPVRPVPGESYEAMAERVRNLIKNERKG